MKPGMTSGLFDSTAASAVARGFFGGDANELRASVGFCAGTRRDLGELRRHWSWTKRSHGHAGAVQFGPNRFGETGDVRFCRGIDGKSCDGQEAGAWS